VQLQVPADYKGAPAAIAADVRYLICREVCIPAKASATLAIPSRGQSQGDAAARKDLFRVARERIPKPLPAGAKATVSDSGANLVLSVDTGMKETKGYFFPIAEGQINNSAPQTATPTPRGVRITMKKATPGAKSTAALKGVVVLDANRAFEVSAPVAGRR
jgi:thiol:disulfide interchange protein DsbD